MTHARTPWRRPQLRADEVSVARARRIAGARARRQSTVPGRTTGASPPAIAPSGEDPPTDTAPQAARAGLGSTVARVRPGAWPLLAWRDGCDALRRRRRRGPLTETNLLRVTAADRHWHARPAADVLAHVPAGADVILPMANGEPIALVDVLEGNHARLTDVRLHQMHALHERPYIHGAYAPHLRHVSYFLSHATREAYRNGTCDLVPNHFSEVPRSCARARAARSSWPRPPRPTAMATSSLGTNAEYVAALIGRVPFFVECNARMPRTFGLNQLHVSQLAGMCESDHPLVEVPPVVPDERDEAIAAHIVERIPNGATLQVGIGGVPAAVLAFVRDHRDLGIHTELLSDGIMDLVERGVVTGSHKQTAPPQDRRDVRARHAAAVRLDGRQRGRGDAAGRAGSTIRA